MSSDLSKELQLKSADLTKINLSFPTSTELAKTEPDFLEDYLKQHPDRKQNTINLLTQMYQFLATEDKNRMLIIAGSNVEASNLENFLCSELSDLGCIYCKEDHVFHVMDKKIIIENQKIELSSN
jgi:hypothetical protein